MMMRYKIVKQYTKRFACLATAIISLVACSHYNGGYEDGYSGVKPKGFIIFGRDDYKTGYEQGNVDSLCDYP